MEKHQSKIQQDPYARRSMSRKIVKMAMTSEGIMMKANIVTMTKKRIKFS